MTTQAEVQMCECVPAAAMRGWREDRACAAAAKATVEWNGIVHHVCGIHQMQFDRFPTRRAELVIRWGWDDAT